jgi:hypothetical protein
MYNITTAMNIVLMLFLFLKVIDFQPRLGIVTRTLSAGPSVTRCPLSILLSALRIQGLGIRFQVVSPLV